MKKIYNGKRYDTDTAAHIARHDNGLPASDFRTLTEDIYRTRNGAWFLHGQGGPLTRWKRPAGDMWTSGEGIEPLTPEDAQAWLERHGFSEEIEANFNIQDA